MDCRTANRLLTPFLEGELELETTEQFLRHIRECAACREELEIHYTVRTAINGLDQDRFQTYDLKKQFDMDLEEAQAQITKSRDILRLRHAAVAAALFCASIAAGIQAIRWF